MKEMNAQHGFVCERWAPRSGHWRGHCNQRAELAPRHHKLHLIQEHRFARAPRAQVQSQFGLFLHDLIVLLRKPSRHWGLQGVLNTILSIRTGTRLSANGPRLANPSVQHVRVQPMRQGNPADTGPGLRTRSYQLCLELFAVFPPAQPALV
jgi:hypothetical protein